MSPPKKKIILLTGATGFIGRHLVKKLLSLNKYSIIAISRFPQKVEELRSQGIRPFQADISKKEELESLAKLPVEIIIHCAACLGSKNSEKTLYKANVGGTENICKLAVELGVERLVYLSSVAVVSGNKQSPLTEDLSYAATNPYGQSKLEAEKKVLTYRRKGVPVVILRPPMVYGEDEPHAFSLLTKLLRCRLIPLPNRGEARLHLAYVENVVEAIIFSLENQNMFKGSFFVADKEVLNISQVFKNMAKGLGAKPPLLLSPFWTSLFVKIPFAGKKFKFLLKDRVYSTEKIESLGFRAPYSAEKALVKSCQAYARQRFTNKA